MTPKEKIKRLINFNSHPQKKMWVLYGVFYGYPDCCIAWFCSKSTFIGKMTGRQRAVVQSTGFIPCDKCARKILDKGLTIHSLIENRISHLKFPADESLKETTMINEAVAEQSKPTSQIISV